MKQFAQGLLHYGVLIAVTIGAALVMLWASGRADSSNGDADEKAVIAGLPVVAMPKALVSTKHIVVESCEIASKFTGKLRPWETYSLAFEVPGRVVKLGNNDRDGPLNGFQDGFLDDGDTVEPGQLLAKMDDRTYRARKSEAVAKMEQAETDMNRIRTLRERNIGAVTETDYQAQLTEVALARAQHEVALKNLEDTQLVSPVAATISHRMVNAGESVQANQMAFELVQVDDLLLVVDVPESQIYELQARQRVVRENIQSGTGDDEDKVFRAHVTLEGRDQFGKQLPTIEAEVFQIAQVADSRTGLFEVEIRVPNSDHSLRAGMVATARIVTARIDAYRIPETAVIFRDREAYLFAVDSEPHPQSVMFWDIGSVELRKSRRVQLTQWLDQGSWIIVPASAHEFDEIVVRGQQRLGDGQFVRVLAEEEESTDEHR